MPIFSALGLAAAVAAAPLPPPEPPSAALTQRIAACLSCHSVKERGDAYFPRIAGKPAGYLYNQLRHFRDGHRHYPMMTYMVGNLSDAYLREIADYFASQHPPYPPAPPGSGSSASAAQVARGEMLVRQGDAAREIPACVSCHGTALTGVAPSIPGLLGLPSDYINAQFGNWKNKSRRAAAPDCMATIAGRLSDSDVAAISAWLSKQVPDAEARPAASTPVPLPIACGSYPPAASASAPSASAISGAAPGTAAGTPGRTPLQAHAPGGAAPGVAAGVRGGAQ